MSDIELVIKINENTWKRICDSQSVPDMLNIDIVNGLNAIKNSTPLPEDHGDLVDRDAVNSRFYDIWHELASYSNKPSHKELLDKWSMCMDTAPTIIDGSDSE